MEPLGELTLVHLSRGQGESGTGSILLRCIEAQSVQFQEHTGYGERDTFVAVSEGMVLSNRVCVPGREANDVDLLVREAIPGAGKCCIQEPFIEKPWRATVVCQKPLVKGKDGLLRNPLWIRLHFARSRSAFL